MNKLWRLISKLWKFKRESKIMKLTADLETTTDENDCRVWAWGICSIDNPTFFKWGTSLDELMNYCCGLENYDLYFHNLAFDGEFILNWLFQNGYKHVIDKRELETKTFSTLISDKGLFYSMTIVFKKSGKKIKKVTLYDSLKILPFSVKEIAEGFKLPMKKGEIDYKKYRPVGYIPDAEELEYLKNDVTIVALALNTLFNQDLTQMTQGSNALHDYKKIMGKKQFEMYFPIPDYDAAIRESYKGGFTYLNPKYKGVDLGRGLVLDVNSLYPSVMRNKPLPYGEGVFYQGKYEPDTVYPLYVQVITCHFELKPDHIPTIQVKRDTRFLETEYLTSNNGEDVTLCLTSVDLELFFQHYDVYNIEWVSGWKFKSTTGLFTEYIDKWSKVKIESKLNKNHAMYILSKLMLNALYGKFALNPNIQSKIPYLDNGIIKYYLGEKETRKPIYIPVGTFITSWARWTTITAAQSVYNRFVYADTDSLHLIGGKLPENLNISNTELGYWKHEFNFSKARYLRQKTYMEYGCEPQEIEKYWKITCAGMPEKCKENVTWDNFKVGNSFKGKLQKTHVVGGIVLKDIEFTIKL